MHFSAVLELLLFASLTESSVLAGSLVLADGIDVGEPV